MKAHTLVFLLLCSSCFLGCASIEEASEKRHKIASEPLQQAVTDLGYEAQAPVERVTDWNLYNWQAVDDHAVIIWVDAFHPYLFTLKERCPALAFAQTVGVSNTTSEINAKFDAIVVPNPPGGGESCYIDKIFPLVKIKK
jgi:hypothetical protein